MKPLLPRLPPSLSRLRNLLSLRKRRRFNFLAFVGILIDLNTYSAYHSEPAEAESAPAAPEAAAEETKEEKVSHKLLSQDHLVERLSFSRMRSRKKTSSSLPRLHVVSLLALVTSSSKNLSTKFPLLQRSTSTRPRLTSLHPLLLWRTLQQTLVLLLLLLLWRSKSPNLWNLFSRLLPSSQLLHNLTEGCHRMTVMILSYFFICLASPPLKRVPA